MEHNQVMQTAGTRKVPWGLLTIISLLFVLMLILVVVVGTLIYTRQLNTTTPSTRSILGANPLNLLDPDQIDPALALASLGGMPESELITEALSKERPETALAVLLFSPNLSSRESSGGFLRLANQYASIGNIQKAIATFELAGTVAILAPELTDTVRADLLLQISEGLIKIDEIELAKFYLDQAFTISSRSPYLQAAHRRGVFEQLHKDYSAIDDRNMARESLSLSANPPALDLVTAAPLLIPPQESIAMPETVQDAEANRWQASQELAILLVERGGQAPQAAINRLRDALIAEDQLKTEFLDTELSSSPLLSEKTNLISAED
jgi:tetratricopeptide (TPR) repeat protein